jgi:hypothetical protein
LAASYVDHFDASAFTYGNHIWLGPGEPVGFTETFAHELAHVVQQTAPPARPAGIEISSAPARRLQRAERKKTKPTGIFWWPLHHHRAKRSAAVVGTKVHKYVLPAFQRQNAGQNKVIIEAQMPGATRRGQQVGKRGFADLYRGKDAAGNVRTVGLNVNMAGDPVRLGRPRARQTNTSRGYNHVKQAAPWYDGRKRGFRRVIRLPQAPVDVRVGDLKPAPADSRVLAGQGKRQLGAYRQGLRKSRTAINDWVWREWRAEAQQAGTPTRQKMWRKSNPRPRWPAITSRASDRLSGLKFPKTVGQTVNLMVMERTTGFWSNGKFIQRGREEYVPKTPIKGKLHLAESPAKNGIYYYYWHPLMKIRLSRLPPEVDALDKKMVRELLEPVRTFRLVQKRPRMEKRPGTRALQRSPRRVARRRRIPQKQDSFVKNKAKWGKAHDRLVRDYRKPKIQSALKKTRTASYASAIDDSLQKNKVLNKARSTSLSTKKQVDRLPVLAFMASKKAKLLGRARALLGRAFAKIANAVQWVKEKIRKRFKPRTSGGPSGFAGVVFKLLLKGLLLTAKVAARWTVRLLARHLVKCVQKRLQSLFPIDNIEKLQQSLATLEKTYILPLKAFARKTAKDLAEGMLGPFVLKVARFLKSIGSWLRKAKWVILGVRAALCVATLWQGGWGCLVQLLGEQALAGLLDNCYVMKAVTWVAMKIGFIRNFVGSLPRRFVNFIFGALARLPLPAGLKEFLSSCRASMSVPTVKTISTPPCGRSVVPGVDGRPDSRLPPRKGPAKGAGTGRVDPTLPPSQDAARDGRGPAQRGKAGRAGKTSGRGRGKPRPGRGRPRPGRGTPRRGRGEPRSGRGGRPRVRRPRPTGRGREKWDKLLDLIRKMLLEFKRSGRVKPPRPPPGGAPRRTPPRRIGKGREERDRMGPPRRGRRRRAPPRERPGRGSRRVRVERPVSRGPRPRSGVRPPPTGRPRQRPGTRRGPRTAPPRRRLPGLGLGPTPGGNVQVDIAAIRRILRILEQAINAVKNEPNGQELAAIFKELMERLRKLLKKLLRRPPPPPPPSGRGRGVPPPGGRKGRAPPIQWDDRAKDTLRPPPPGGKTGETPFPPPPPPEHDDKAPPGDRPEHSPDSPPVDLPRPRHDPNKRPGGTRVKHKKDAPPGGSGRPGRKGPPQPVRPGEGPPLPVKPGKGPPLPVQPGQGPPLPVRPGRGPKVDVPVPGEKVEGGGRGGRSDKAGPVRGPPGRGPRVFGPDGRPVPVGKGRGAGGRGQPGGGGAPGGTHAGEKGGRTGGKGGQKGPSGRRSGQKSGTGTPQQSGFRQPAKLPPRFPPPGSKDPFLSFDRKRMSAVDPGLPVELHVQAQSRSGKRITSGPLSSGTWAVGQFVLDVQNSTLSWRPSYNLPKRKGESKLDRLARQIKLMLQPLAAAFVVAPTSANGHWQLPPGSLLHAAIVLHAEAWWFAQEQQSAGAKMKAVQMRDLSQVTFFFR